MWTCTAKRIVRGVVLVVAVAVVLSKSWPTMSYDQARPAQPQVGLQHDVRAADHGVFCNRNRRLSGRARHRATRPDHRTGGGYDVISSVGGAAAWLNLPAMIALVTLA